MGRYKKRVKCPECGAVMSPQGLKGHLRGERIRLSKAVKEAVSLLRQWGYTCRIDRACPQCGRSDAIVCRGEPHIGADTFCLWCGAEGRLTKVS